MLGFSINLLILFGLVLAVGLVVDDAIVVLENTQRHIQEGKSPREATEITMVEVFGAVVATSLVLMAVFVPVSFMTGITGQMFRQFAVCIAVSRVTRLESFFRRPGCVLDTQPAPVSNIANIKL